MRILLTANTAFNLVNFRSGLIRSLAADGHGLTALVPRDTHVASLEDMGCKVIPLDMNPKGTALREEARMLLAMWRAFSSIRPDVVLSYTIKNNLYGALAARWMGVPLLPNVTGLGMAFGNRDLMNWMVVGLYRLTFPRLPVVFFQNPDDQELFRGLGIVEGHQARLLPGSGVDTQAFPEALLPGDEERVTFLLVSRLLWAKGIGEFVQAARRVRERAPKASFQILGRFELDNRFAIPRDVVANWMSEGSVEYLGEVEDVRPVIAGADCVVLPSYYREGTPRALLEAAAMGRPIVTTDTPGCRDVVEDGVTGLLCHPGDAGDLADRLGRIVALGPEGRAQMGKAGRLRMEQYFDERIVIEAYRRALVELSAVNPTSMWRIRKPARSSAD